jgi:hypothetical protein
MVDGSDAGGSDTGAPDAGSPDSGSSPSSSVAPPQTAGADYVDKTDLTPVQYALLVAGANPGVLTASVLAREPAFYSQSTLLSQPAGSGFLGLTTHSRTDQIRWQFTETSLTATRIAELAPTSTWTKPVTGAVVATFAVSLHFDLQKTVDAKSGAVTYTEDTTSHPWYARRYARVDWSQNLAGDSPVASFDVGFGVVPATAVPFEPASPSDPGAPFFSYTNVSPSQVRLDAFDLVNEAQVQPAGLRLGTSPDVPICALGEGDEACGNGLVTWRTAFLRIDPTRDYQTISFGPGAGASRLDAARFGVRDSASVGPLPPPAAAAASAVRLNIWARHHAPALGADTTVLCNVDADCAAGALCHIGAQAPDASHRGACAPAGFDHRTTDAACAADADCAPYGTAALSPTAACDAATKTCGERFIRCAKDADCVASVGALSTCDLAAAALRPDGSGLCTLPFAGRQVRPVAFHESPGFPDELQPAAAQALAEWNGALSLAVTAARRHECEIAMKIDPTTVPLASNPCNAPAVTGAAGDAAAILVGCHDTVWGVAAGPGQHTQAEVDAAHAAGWDLAACGPQGTAARIGDLRSNVLEAITDRVDGQDSWGLSNVAADARTGEIVAGRASLWQTVTAGYAAEVVSLVHLLRGDYDPGTQGLDLATGGFISQAEPATTGVSSTVAPALATSSVAALIGDGTDGSQRLAALRGTPFEQQLVGSDQARLATGATPDDDASLAQTMDVASPLREQSPSFRRAIERLRVKLRAEECRMLPGFSPDNVLGLARDIAKAYPVVASNADDAGRAFGRDWTFVNTAGTVDDALVETYARLVIAHAVLAHELGHALGLRENLAGSADALNFDDGYWQNRGAGHPGSNVPRTQYLSNPSDATYYSKQEIAYRLEEHSYASIMDDRDVSEVAHGLGRYDVAAIKSVYAGLLQVFKSVPDQDHALTYAWGSAGAGTSTTFDLTRWPNAVQLMHYTQIPTIFGATDDSNRYDVFQRETISSAVPTWGPPLLSNTTSDGHVVVPYRSGDDASAGLDWRNLRGDVGPDAYEAVSSLAARMVLGYFATSFAHAPSTLSASKYVDHVRTRFVDPIRQAGLTAMFDLVAGQDAFGEVPNWATTSTSGFALVNQSALDAAGNALFALLDMPEQGPMAPAAQFDGSSLIVPTPFASGASPVNFSSANGRALASLWGTSADLPWFDQLERAGSYYDKTIALQALTDRALPLPASAGLGFGTPPLVQLGFATLEPGTILRLAGGWLAHDMTDVAPTYLAPSTVSRPGLAAITSGHPLPAGQSYIDPQDPTPVDTWALVLFGAGLDPALSNYTRLWFDGGPGAVSTSSPTVSFVDPFSGITYRALSVDATRSGLPPVGASTYVHPSTGKVSSEAGVAARMILHLQDLETERQLAVAGNKPAVAQAVATQEQAYLDIVRRLADLNGQL